jgi:hypothetical protein
MALRVFGVIMQDGQGTPKVPDGLKLHSMRELAAVAEEVESGAREIGEKEISRHAEVVSAMFSQDAILPTPVGTVFRSGEVLQRWMELHYVSLSDALAWLEGRQAARVHITRAQARNGDREAGSDLAAIGAEVTRSLRRHAVSTVPLRSEEVTGIVLTAAYLVERELWSEFADAVETEAENHPLVKIELTGPWPPYDFVRLQFGS